MAIAGREISVAALSAIAYAIFVAYFALYSRHHLVAEVPGEQDPV